MWREEHQKALDEIKHYLVNPPVLVPPQKHKPFKLYLSADERLCLCLYFSCTKLRHYLLSTECVVVSKDDIIKYMLSLPILNGRIGKWILALSEFDLRYESAKAVKGQVMADFVVQHCGPEVGVVDLVPWT